jgi:hypothetical protein
MTKSVLCCVAGCRNVAGVPGSARGLCRPHYRRWQNHGSEHATVKRIKTWKGETCAECDSPVYAKGLCEKHYAAIRRRYDPEGQKRRNNAWRERRNDKQEQLMGRARPVCCELCGEQGYGRKPSIVFDHCHETGTPRGWLCDRCNKVLGLVKDDPELLRKMVAYLGGSHGKVDRQEQKPFVEAKFCTAR